MYPDSFTRLMSKPTLKRCVPASCVRLSTASTRYSGNVCGRLDNFPEYDVGRLIEKALGFFVLSSTCVSETCSRSSLRARLDKALVRLPTKERSSVRSL